MRAAVIMSSNNGSAAAYAELRSKHNRLIEVLGVTVNYKDELADKIAHLTDALREAEAERDAARNQNSSSSETVAQKDARIRFLEEHANESLQTIQQLREQLTRGRSAQAAKHTALKKSVAALRKQVATIRDDLRNAASRQGQEIAEMVMRMGVLRKAASRRKPNSAAAADKAAADNASAAAAAAETKVQVLEKALGEREGKVRALEGQLVGQNKRIRELEFSLSEQADGFAAKLSFSKVENSELLSQLASARTFLKAAEGTIAELREQLAATDTAATSGSAFKQFLDVKAENQKLLEQLKRLRAKAGSKKQ